MPKSRRARRGGVLVLSLALIPAMLATATIAIEFGHVSVFHGNLQNAVDAASKAGAIHVAHGPNRVRSEVTASLAEAGWNDADLTSIAVDYGRWDDQTNTFIPLAVKDDAANAVRVRAEADVSSLMGSYVGIESWNGKKQATARRPGIALAVKDVNNFVANDKTMLSQLRSIGVPLRLLSQDQLDANCITEGELLFISSSVSSSHVDESVQYVPGPVLVGETNLYDTFAFTNGRDHVTHGNTNATSHDVEVDLYDLQTLAGWQQEWEQWWRNNETKLPMAKKTSYTADGDSEERVQITKASTSSKAPHGYARRNALGDAIVIATAGGQPDNVTVFWYDKGATLGGGGTAPYRQAGVFIRTSENSHDMDYTYSSDAYELMAQTIRWLLHDQEARTVLVQ